MKIKLRPAVLLIPSIIFAIVIAAGVIYGDTFITVLKQVFEKLMGSLGWMVSLTMLLFVIFMIVIIFHPIGKIRLGGPNAKPKMNYWQWFTVALCAGIGTGVVFWGAVEPLLFTMEPAPSLGLEPGSDDAVIWAMRTTYLHWTIVPYAIYVTFGLILAYVCYNMRQPFNVSSGFVPLMGEKATKGKFATVVDVLTVFALVGGIAGTLGYGILQLSKGLEVVFDIKSTAYVCIIITAVIMVAYLSTSISGLKKGIMWLGDKNTWFYIILLLFLLVCGPTTYIFNLFTQSIGSFANHFVESITYTAPFTDGEMWPQWWDQYWWVDWLSYGAIMGLFFVRLGYGRTLREFVIVNWIMPSVFGFIWFSIFGGTVLHDQLFKGVDHYAQYKADGMEVMTFTAFDGIPGSMIIKAFMILIIAISFITLANSMISTVASMSVKFTGGKSGVEEEAPVPLKVFWGVLIGAASLVFTLTGGVDGIKMVKTFAGFPILFVGILMLAGFVFYMAKRPRNDRGQYEYEDCVANAPDSDEKPMPDAKWLVKLKGIVSRKGSN